MAGKKVILLSGQIQTGKTTALFNWIKGRNDVVGILTPVKDGKRCFYSILEDMFYPMEANENEEILEVGRFKFSAKQFKKTNNAILKWLDNTHCKYLIVDEVGPLEMKQQKGLWSSFQQILNGEFTATIIIVVRKNLSETVKDLLISNGLKVFTTSVDEFQQFVED